MKHKTANGRAQDRDESKGSPSQTALPHLLQQLAVSPESNHTELQSPAINAEQVEQLAFYGLEVAAIALLLDCDPTELTEQFAGAVAHGRARRVQFLLEKLADLIEANQWPALRFALKNVVGMADNPEQAALQRRKLDQLRTPELSPVSPPEFQPMVVQSGPASEALPSSVSLPEQKKPPAPVRPRQRPGKQPEGGSACVPRK